MFTFLSFSLFLVLMSGVLMDGGECMWHLEKQNT